MDVPRLFKTATPEFVARKVFKIKSLRRNEDSPKTSKRGQKEQIELTLHAPDIKSEAVLMTEPSNDIETSSTDTGTSKMENSPNSRVPVLAVGTYHRKEAAPILAAAARLDLPSAAVNNNNTPSTSKGNSKNEHVPPLPHPSECGQPCVSGQSQMFQHRTTTTAQGPPPAWQPPRPPGQSEHDYTNDYEDPEELARSRDGTASLLMKSPQPSALQNFNSYEMSLSQQRRSQQQQQQLQQKMRCEPAAPLLDWSNENGGVLHKNAEGAYYIPSGSLRTTSSTLSPASSGQRYLDQPHTSVSHPQNTAFSDASSTLLKYPLTGTQPNRRRQVSNMNTGDGPPGGPQSIMMMNQKQKKKKLGSDGSSWFGSKPSKCALVLAALLILAILIILFQQFKSPSYVYTEQSPSSDSTSLARYAELGLRALPPAISLGERIDVEFMPKHMATTELIISRSARVAFNATVGSGAQLVLLIRAGVPPSLSLHDAIFPLRADRIRDPKSPTHVVEEADSSGGSSTMLRLKRSVVGMMGGRRIHELVSPKTTNFEYFMLEGRHFLTFINERNRVEPISFIAEEVISPTTAPTKTGEHPLKTITCEANCNDHGECVQGKCRCANGYTGSACEETICPIVCSGHGVFSGGVCVCKTGFKGKECEMRANWCEVADCNGRGRCDTDGKCRCNSGWTGDSCEQKACPHSTCHDRGVCVNGTCYCSEGWRGNDCSVFADSHVQTVVPLPLSPNQNPNENPQKKQKPKPKPVDKVKDQENKKETAEKRPIKDRELPTFSTKESKIDNKLSCTKNGKLIDELYCECNDGWDGEDCGNRNCGNNCTNGDCVDGNCLCWKGWNGPSCGYPDCAKGCEEHGSCQPDGSCKCKMGYNGENCYQDGCPNQCSGKGECSLDTRSSSWFCQCQAGSTGSDCSISIEMHCDDGMDNDNDGLIDCDDPECCDSPSCVEESVCSTSVSPTEVLLRMPPVFNGNFAQRIGFLIKEKSVQSYTDASQFNESLMAVVRGRVVWRGSSSSNSQGSDEVVDSSSFSAVPLLGVRVSDASHPLYGFTLTRADGYFDLVVNGARSVNLQFLRTQFQGVKKSVYVAPRQIVHIDDIVLYRSSAIPAGPPPPARAKCSPTLRKVPDVVMISNWQYTSDGIQASEQDSAKLVIDSRSIVESFPVSGTNIRMVYDSTRSPAAPSTMLIGLLDDVIDKDLRKIHLNIRIGGRRFDYVLAPKINLTHVFAWDKMNAYRQSETGLVATTIRVGYEYLDCERESEIVWVNRRSQMLGATSRKMIGNMWTLDVHHHLDVVNNIVEMGDGGYRLIEEYEPKVSTLAGIDGMKRDIDCGDDKCDGLLDKISLFRPTALAYALDGSLIIGDHNLIRRIAPDGSINTILTLSLADTSHSYYLAVSPFDGTIAISLPLHKQIWKISSLTPHDSRGNYEILVGDGSVCGSAVDACGDGGLAQNAQLIFPKGIAYDRVGNLYLADSRRIRVIDTAGHIRSIGETTPESHPIRTCAQITKLVDLQMEWPTSLSIDLSSGLIYVLDTNVVYEIDVAQDLVTVALGVPMTCDGASSSNSGINNTSNLNRHLIQNARDISVSNDGSIYVVESDGKRLNQVRKLSADRLKLTVLVGGRSPCSCDVAACGCDDSTSQRQVSASAAHLNSPHSVVIAPSGDVVIADSVNAKVKMIGVRMANYDGKTRSYEVTDAEMMQKYTFNRHGLHTSTISILTGKAVYNFCYTVDSPTASLTKIYGSSGLSLSVVRYNQTLTDLKTSSGEITSLTLSAYDGTLEMSSRRATSSTPILLNQKDSIRMAYTSKGLLSSKVDVASAIAFEYDKNGRAEGMRREREYWKIGEERISMGRINVEVLLNGHRFLHVRMGEGDLAVLNSYGVQTRLITLQREGYSMTSPFATSSLFDKSGGDEPVVSRRRTTVPAIANPQRRALTTRWDWRYVMKQRGEQRRVAEVDFRPRINGVNMYSMEYDVSKNRDTLRIGSSSDESSVALHVEYTDGGEVSRIYQPKGSDENRIDEMNITWDSEGRKERIQWGNWKIQNSYDDRNRLIEKVEDGARVPVKMTYSGAGAARRPTSIHHDGATWNIQYDNYERIKEISSPNGESTSFSAISLGGDEWVLKRKTSSNTKPNMVRIGRNGEILEFATADGAHHWMVKKDEASGRIEQIINDDQVIQVTCWSPEGDVLCTKSKQVQENATLQGHLIARREIVIRPTLDQVISSSFTYEYDDLLRPISIQPVIDQSVVQPIQITYDARTGHVASLNDYNLVRDSTTTRCQRNGMLVETSRIESHRQVVERKLVWGDVRAAVKIGRDGVGRAIESVLEVNSPGNQKTSKTTRTFDAAGRVASIEENGEKMRINWNQEGRVEKVDDRLVVYHRGGAMMTFLDVGYNVNLIGSVTKRQNISFSYDGKGRLISAKSDIDKKKVELIYDNQDRLVSIAKSNSVISLYYGREDNAVSHFSKNGVIFTIFYDENLPFAMVGDDGSRFGLLVDETGTLRVVASDSKVIKSVDRGVFGGVLEDSNKEFWLPIGYLGGIDIPGINVTILKNGRPYDLVSGRYMSVSSSAVTRLDFNDFANSIDLLALETNMQPFQIPKIPTDVSAYFVLSGMSPSLLPAASAQLGLPRESSIAHRLLSSFPRKLDPLTHLNTIVPSGLSGQNTQDVDVMWSIEDAGFSNLLILNQDQNGVVDVETLPILTVEESEVVKKIINGAKVLDFGTWSPVPVRHLWKKTPLESLSSASFSHFTLVANNESAELRNGKSKIVVHFAVKRGDVMKKLMEELRNRENLAVWKSERQRLENGEKLWMEWNDREQRELKSKGSVSGYETELKSTHKSALFATIHSWKFTRV